MRDWLADRIRAAREDLTSRWLLAGTGEADAPSTIAALQRTLPQLFTAVADHVAGADGRGDEPLLAQAMEFGDLRFTQGADATGVLRDCAMLGDVLFACAEALARESSVAATEVLQLGHRLYRAIAVVEQGATAPYLRALTARVEDREDRLQRCGRLITHELKNRVGAAVGAGQLLQEEWLASAERQRFAGMVEENARAVQQVLENVVSLSRLDGDGASAPRAGWSSGRALR